MLYEVKKRDPDKASAVLVTGMEMVEKYCQNIPQGAYRLAEKYWPGPLTMILEDKGVVSPATTGEGDTLGVRCPNHPVTLAVIEKAGVALAAPSANPAGQPSPKTAQEVLDYFDGHMEDHRRRPLCPGGGVHHCGSYRGGTGDPPGGGHPRPGDPGRSARGVRG